MKNRTVSILLCAALIICVFAGCGDRRSAKDEFKKLLEAVSKIEEGSFELKLEYGVTASEEDGTEGESIKADAAGSFSVKNARMAADISFNMAGDDSQSIKTDIVAADNRLYVNFRSIFEALLNEAEAEDAEYGDIFESDYVYYSLEEYASLFSASEGGGFNIDFTDFPACKEVWDFVADTAKSVISSRAYSFSGDSVKFSLTKDMIESILTKIVDNAGENADLYVDAYMELTWAAVAGELEAAGAAQEEMDSYREQLLSTDGQVREMIAQLKEAYDQFDWSEVPAFSFSAAIEEKGGGEYDITLKAAADTLYINADLGIKSGQAEEVKIPESTMPYEDIEEMFGGVLGEEKTAYVNVTHSDGTTNEYYFSTDQEYLLDGLYYESSDFFAGYYDEDDNFILLGIDGETADADAGEEWVLYIDGVLTEEEMDDVKIAHGSTYDFVFSD